MSVSSHSPHSPHSAPTGAYFRAGTLPFWIIHVLCLGAFFVDFSWWYVALAAGSYLVRMFFVTGVYHRYFSHKSYSTSRVMQFILAFGAETTVQKGVLWWAAHHRHHHTHSDQEDDIHSPKDGFWWSHIGWFLSNEHNTTEERYIRDLMRYPELVWLNKYYLVPPTVWGILMFAIAGVPGLIWGLCISTVALWHGTFTINSLSHLWGWQRYATTDTSRNNPVLALITLGEGWHNNHHRFQSSARNGFFWWEIDITYYVLKMMSWVGLVWDLRPVPEHLLDPHNETWIKNASAAASQAASQAAAAASQALTAASVAASQAAANAAAAASAAASAASAAASANVTAVATAASEAVNEAVSSVILGKAEAS